MTTENTSIARVNLEKSLRAKSLDDLVRVKRSENVFLLLDCSGSMSDQMRNGKRRIDGLRETVKEIQSKRAVRMIVFCGVDAEGREARFTESVPSPNGGTPMEAAIELARKEGAGRVVVVSDGWPNNPQLAMEAASRFGGQIDVVFVGDPGDPGAAFLEELAKSTGGTSFDGDLSEPKELTGAIVGLLNGATEDDDEENGAIEL